MIDLAENLQRSAKKLLLNPSAKAVQDYVHDSVELIGKLINEFVALKAEKKLLDAELKHVHGDFSYCQELNAGLLIERDQLKAKLAEIDRQKPIARGYKNSQTGTCSELYWLGDVPEGETYLYASPVQQSPALAVQRITEQEALEIAKSVQGFVAILGSCYSEAWLNQLGRTLIAKLNGGIDV